jgi:4-hydroxy-tetrahydrodipicolinate synthase
MRINVGEVITAMVTPFTANLEVDYAGVERIANHLADNGTDAILVAGTTGESPTLTHEEELEILKTVKNAVGNRVKVVMGAGSNSTVTAVEMSRKVENVGVDAILSVVPYYNKPSQRGMVEHFSQIASAVDIPIIVYNIPGRTGVNMLPDTVAELAEKYSNIAAIKQSNPDLDLITEIAMKTPDDFVIYSGDDSLTLPMLSLGGYGVISVASHLCGTQIKQMITAYKNSNVEEATKLQHKYYPLFKALFTSPNPTPLKAALQEIGLINDTVRPPLVTLTEDEKAKLRKTLDMYQLAVNK